VTQKVTGQLTDTPTRGLPTHGLDDSRTGHLAHWSTRGLDNSRTGQLADATGDFACLVFVLLAASARLLVVQSATCPVRELSSPRVDQSVRCPVRELAIRELAYLRVVQLPPRIRLNLCFLRPTRVNNPNGKSIGSAASAQLTSENLYT